MNALDAIAHSGKAREAVTIDFDEDDYGELLYRCNGCSFTYPGHYVFAQSDWCVLMRHETEEQRAAKAAYREALDAEADPTFTEQEI